MVPALFVIGSLAIKRASSPLVDENDARVCSDDESWLAYWRTGGNDFAPAAAQRYPAYVGRALMLLQGNAHFGQHVVVDIGANKGVMSAGFFESMCPSKMRRWDNAVRTNGELAASVGPAAVRAAEQHDKKSRKECPTIYAIEADPRIATSLLPHVPAVHGFPPTLYKVHNIAMYSEDGEMDFGLDSNVGGELGSLKPGRRLSAQNTVRRIKTMRYDSFAAKQGILKASWVKVDAEGIDPYILHGMEGSLRAKAVLGLQFEFSELWELKNRTHTLRHAVDFLDGLGYHTYYAGRSLLMPLWGSHWREPYGLGRWSDMVALQAHSSFERYFLRQFLPGPPCPS